jgi:hypothetical protein
MLLDFSDPASALWWITLGKLIIGAGLLTIIVGSLYRFQGVVLTTMGVLLASNVVCLMLIMAMTQ